MVLDEPTASLDFGNQGQVMREIRRLADRRWRCCSRPTIPNQAARFADQALLIRDGGIQAHGPVRAGPRRKRLEALYGSPVEEIEDREGRGGAFLPG